MLFRFDKLLIIFLIAISFVPLQIITYVGPFIVLPLLLFLRANFRFYTSDKNILVRYIFYFLMFILIAITSSFINQTSLINFSFATLTYFSSITVFFAVFLFPYHKEHLKIAMFWLVFLSIIQVFVGTYQLYSVFKWSVINPFVLTKAAGDFFVGTVNHAHLLAVKLIFMASILTSLLVGMKNIKYLILAGIITLGWILCSAMHTIVIAVVTLLFIIVIKLLKRFFKLLLGYKKDRGRVIFAFLAIVITLSLTAIIQKNNIRYSIDRMSIKKENPRKWIGLKNTIFKLPMEKYYAPIIGVGFGSYSSRAALITSGEYLRSHPPFIPISLSKETKKFIAPLWNKELLKNPRAHGVANQPFSTWQSIYGELGLAGIVVFCLIFFQNLNVFSSLSKSSNIYLKSISYAMWIFTFYLFFLFFFDNWFEYPRFMIPYWMIAGLLLKEVGRVKSTDKEKEVNC